jgi:hypothetical protein
MSKKEVAFVTRKNQALIDENTRITAHAEILEARLAAIEAKAAAPARVAAPAPPAVRKLDEYRKLRQENPYLGAQPIPSTPAISSTTSTSPGPSRPMRKV